MVLNAVTLNDKFDQEAGRIFLSGVQALVRLPIMQRRLDIKANLNTGGFISGYRGSPLGNYDMALGQAAARLRDLDIHFAPGLNEDLAATACWGAQQAPLLPGATKAGVFAIWYGKGPGVDRSGDALKHGNFAGASRHGGVLALAGDDHAAKSSTTSHQSEQAFIAAMMPVLNPASLSDLLEAGLFGIALSRYSGLWVGLKCATEVVETSGTIEVSPDHAFRRPDFPLPADGLNLRMGFNPAGDEERVVLHRLPAAKAFARANRLDHPVLLGQRRELGIVSAGKAYADARKALAMLGLTDERCAALGLNVYKCVMTWPLETEGAADFAQGHRELFVIEEKRPVLEDQLRAAFYHLPAERRPRIVGKADESGAALLPAHGELSPLIIARRLVERLEHLGLADDALREQWRRLEAPHHGEGGAPAPAIVRTPAFCSGCPHNTSTKLPEGSLAMGGIGCHTMAIFMPDRPTLPPTQMGGEGANWIGARNFSTLDHVFQNMGDGTYFHSGLLAIRAAIASGATMTYKILYNDAVAMTGGQAVDGVLTVSDIVRQLDAENVARIVLVSDEPDKTYVPALPATVARHGRDELIAVEKELRETEGVTVLVYDQACAAEKRRRRKRKLIADPPKRYYINDAVCEGCGDCSEKSSCVSIAPLETAFGRKRKIDQSSCNKDYSCVEGFCPSFVTVHGGKLKKSFDATLMDKVKRAAGELPQPSVAQKDGPHHTLVAGIGGTGVVTIGALLGMAAHLEGLASTLLDITGLSQKNGAVLSHVSVAPANDAMFSSRIGPAEADLVLGCDLIVAGGGEARATIRQDETKVVLNSGVTATAAFQRDRDLNFEADGFLRAIKSKAGAGNVSTVDAASIAECILGDKIGANAFLLGYACQSGGLPVSAASLLKAIELNGVAVEFNKNAFLLGRVACAFPDFEGLAAPARDKAVPQSFPDIVAHRRRFLAAYQDEAYAQKYASYVEAIASKARAKGFESDDFLKAVAAGLAKLMAYKDEYEVARLHADGAFRRKLEETFEGDYTVSYNLAPPVFARRDSETGHLIKREFGPWMGSVFSLLKRLKFLRGTAFDIFGRTQERRMEVALIGEYRKAVEAALDHASSGNRDLAIEIARLPEMIRGFGHVKDASVEKARARMTALLEQMRAPPRPSRADNEKITEKA